MALTKTFVHDAGAIYPLGLEIMLLWISVVSAYFYYFCSQTKQTIYLGFRPHKSEDAYKTLPQQ